MRKPFAPVLAVVFALVVSGLALAGNTANQTVSFEVYSTDQIAVSGNPDTLVIDSVEIGGEPDDATSSVTSYAYTTNNDDRRINGRLDFAMPEGTWLSIELQAPLGAWSEGPVLLDTFGRDLVTGIDAGYASGKTITYRFHCPVESGFVGTSSRTVTLTLTGAM
jgi:hypothetical protein